MARAPIAPLPPAFTVRRGSDTLRVTQTLHTDHREKPATFVCVSIAINDRPWMTWYEEQPLDAAAVTAELNAITASIRARYRAPKGRAR